MNHIEYTTSRLQAVFMHRIIGVQKIPFNEHMIEIKPADLCEIVIWLLTHSNCYHLSTITAIDTGQNIEVLYHFWDAQGLTLKVQLNRESPQIDSLTNIIPGAIFYEREIFEMFGVHFSGLQRDRPLLMADDWDGQQFPMRVKSHQDTLSENKEQQ